MKLPRLLVQLWGRENFKEVSDISGGFIVVDEEIEI